MKQLAQATFCRDESRKLLAIFLAALLVRVVFILTLQNGFYFVDSVDYSRAATSLIVNGEFGANYGRAPAYPVFLAAVYLVSGESILAVRVVESVIGAFLAILMATLGIRIGGAITGLLAGAIWVIYPMGIFVAGLVYPTGLATLFLACGVRFALPANEKELSGKNVFLSGVCFGLTALAVPVALLTIVLVAAWVFYCARHSRVLLTCLLLLGSAVSLGPWTVRNLVVHEKFVVVQPNFEKQLPRLGTRGTNIRDDRISSILRHFDSYAVHLGKNFLRFWELYPSGIKMSDQHYRDKLHAQDSRVVKETIYNPNRLINAISILSTGPIFLFALLGTAAMWTRKELRSKLTLLWMTILSFAVGYSFFFAKIRYRVPVEPYIIILAAYGIHAVYILISHRFPSMLAPAHPLTSRPIGLERAQSPRRSKLDDSAA